MAGEKRIMIPLEQAVELLEAGKGNMVKTFHQIGNQRIIAPWRRDDLVNLMITTEQAFGGIELAGKVAREHGYGLTIFRGDVVKQLPQKMAGKLPLGWLFVSTKPGVCCRCGGSGKVAKMAFQILPSKCEDCGGIGRIPQATESIFKQELKERGA